MQIYYESADLFRYMGGLLYCNATHLPVGNRRIVDTTYPGVTPHLVLTGILFGLNLGCLLFLAHRFVWLGRFYTFICVMFRPSFNSTYPLPKGALLHRIRVPHQGQQFSLYCLLFAIFAISNFEVWVLPTSIVPCKTWRCELWRSTCGTPLDIIVWYRVAHFLLTFLTVAVLFILVDELTKNPIEFDSLRLRFLKWEFHTTFEGTDAPVGSRKMVRIFNKTFCKATGLTFHQISGSASTDHGSHAYLFPSDTKFREMVDNRPIEPHLLVLEDVDYYLDLPSVLMEGVRTGCMYGALIYTLQPRVLAKSCETFHYYFDKGAWHYLTREGMHYNHEIWDYNTDLIVCHDYLNSYVFTVDRRELPGDRCLIYLELQNVVYRTAWSPTLRRLAPITEMGEDLEKPLVQRLDTYVLGTPHHSFSAFAYPQVCFDINHKTLVEVIARFRRCEKVYASELERILQDAKVIDPGFAASCLALWVDKGWIPGPFTGNNYRVLPQDTNDYAYQPESSGTFLDKPSMHPKEELKLLNEGVAPTEGKASDANFVKTRIVDVKNDKEPSEKYNTYKKEFLELLNPKRVYLKPWLHDDVLERQKKPTQKAKSFVRQFWGKLNLRRNCWTSFMKHEAYGTFGDARGISCPSTDLKEDYSSFTYPLYEAVRHFKWFAFGHSPEALAQLVHTCCSKSETVCVTDYSRWDGRHSKWLAEFERDLLLGFFYESEHPLILKLWGKNYLNNVKTRHGVKFHAEWSRPSGSPDTALFNTIDNAFLAYCAFREQGGDKSYSWRMLGIYGGDDGLTPQISKTTYDKVAADFGVKLEAEELPSSLRVPFLGRLYLSPKFTSDSVIDIRRSLGKFHLTKDKKASFELVAARKANAYVFTDSKTPIVRTLITKWADPTLGLGTDDSWWARVVDSTKSYFPCKAPESALASFVASELGLTVGEVYLVEQAILDDEVVNLPAKALEVKLNCLFRGQTLKKGETFGLN
jgi:hypothetical protein